RCTRHRVDRHYSLLERSVNTDAVIDNVDARRWLRHACATIAYRAAKALRGAPASFGAFRVGERSRTPSEIVAHLGDLFDWALSLAKGQQVWRDTSPAEWDADVRRFFGSIEAFDAYLGGPEPLNCEWTRLFQGPLADALTHVGQLTMLRRIAGAPIRAENYYKADIATGRVGANQTPPRREFD